MGDGFTEGLAGHAATSTVPADRVPGGKGRGKESRREESFYAGPDPYLSLDGSAADQPLQHLRGTG